MNKGDYDLAVLNSKAIDIIQFAEGVQQPWSAYFNRGYFDQAIADYIRPFI